MAAFDALRIARTGLGMHQTWLDALAHSQASDDAGKPNLAGEGWRQKCLPEVLSWWKANPRGDWRRCWDTIPNGFRSASEMKKAFRKAVRDQ